MTCLYLIGITIKHRTLMIQISRKERQFLNNLQKVMVAHQAETFTEEMLQDLNPGYDLVESLVEKAVLNPEEGTITKDQLQVLDEDAEVEAAWQACREIVPAKSLFENTAKKGDIAKANRDLEKVLFKKGRLIHMVKGDEHIWVTDAKVQDWLNRGWKEGNQKAVPYSRD